MIKLERTCLAGFAFILSACGSSTPLDSKATTAFGWRAEPAMIANTGVYREREFVYQDYVYDDHGANTDGRDRFDAPLGTPGPDPSDPVNPRLSPAPLINYAGDFLYASPDGALIHTVADLIEFRVATDAERVHYRFRMGDMTAPDSAVIALCVDEDNNPATGLETWPLGANHTEQLGCDHFYSIYGTGGQVADASGASKRLDDIGGTVSTDMSEALIEFSVPKSFADPGRKTWRFYVASGVWDAAKKTWAAPTPLPAQAGAPVATGGDLLAPNIYDLLSNNQEPNSTWNEEKQANDLSAHHLVDDYLDVDFARISDGANDPDPRRTGVVERIYRSNHPMALGRGIDLTGSRPNKVYLGEWQPYVAVIPSNYYDDPNREFAFDFCMHPLGANHNVEVYYAEAFSKRDYNPVVTGVFPSTGYLGFTQVTSLIDRQQLVYACVLGRGEGVGYIGGDGLVDTLEVQDDMLARYRIEDAHRTVHGVSLGALGTWYLARLYPERYSAAMPYIFSPSLTPGFDTSTLANLYNLPTFYSIGTFDQFSQGAEGDPTADAMEGFGNEYLYLHYLGRQHEGRIEQDFLPFVAKLAYTRTRERNPPRVKYVFNPAMFSPKIPGKGEAYWVSAMVPRGTGSASIDVTDLARADQLPGKQVVFSRLYENPDKLYSTRMRGLFRLSRADYDALWHPEQWEPGWTEAPAGSTITETDLKPPRVSNAFVLVATNLAEVVLDAARMKLAGGATYVVVTDGTLVIRFTDGRVLNLPAAGTYEGSL